MAKINDTYDIVQAIEAIENELIASMIRNLDHHRLEEVKEKKNWSQWQVEQLAALDAYKKRSLEKHQGIFDNINRKIGPIISAQRTAGNANQEIAILQAIKKGAKIKKPKGNTQMIGEFFTTNDRKINALIKATTDDMKKGEIAIFRRANDQYRKIIYNAQMYASMGASYQAAIDMATKDFLSAGINCIEYKNGARHSLSSYAGMALRTAQKRAYLTGEGEKRMEWGIHTVIMNKRGNPCPKCLPWVGKILIDDIWSGGTEKEAKEQGYPLMSQAIAKGLYHPNCRDSHTTYFPDISEPPDDRFTKQEIQKVEEGAKEEARGQYAKREAQRFERLASYSLAPENIKRYKAREKEWKETIAKYHFEDEASKRKYLIEDTIIKTEVIETPEYRRRIDVLEENIKTKRSIWNKAKEMLQHRNGTEYEDLAFIDSKTGKSFINKSYHVKRQAKPNKRMKKLLEQSEPYTIIAIHNHPGSSIPSISDIRAAHKRKYKYGLIVCHNGTIYKYFVSENYNDACIISALARLEEKGYTKEVKKLFKDAGIEMEVL